MNRWLLPVVGIGLLLFTSGEGIAQDDLPFESPYDNGVLTLEMVHIDDLLYLDEAPALRIVEITNPGKAEVSSAHLTLLERWVESGGALWFHGRGFESSLWPEVNPGIDLYYTELIKESGAKMDGRNGDVGELFVRDLLPSINIADHPVTEGIERLYVQPEMWEVEGVWMSRVFTSSSSARVEPILSFRQSRNGLRLRRDRVPDKPERRSFVLLGLVERGSGLLIVDLTRIGAKDWKGPDGDAYDAPLFYRNIKRYGYADVYEIAGTIQAQAEYRFWERSRLSLAIGRIGEADSSAGSKVGRVTWEFFDEKGGAKRTVRLRVSSYSLRNGRLKFVGRVISDTEDRVTEDWFAVLLEPGAGGQPGRLAWSTDSERGDLPGEGGTEYSREELFWEGKIVGGDLRLSTRRH